MYKDIIEKFGELNQKIVATEELSELIKEITKDLRGKLDRDHLLEEYVDVNIMLEQLRIIYDFKDDEIEKMVERKVKNIWTKES